MRALRALGWFLGLCLLVAFGGELQRLGVTSADPLSARCAEPGRADAVLFLVGDAGVNRKRDPLLRTLADETRESVAALGRERVAIGFLGDNLYPKGLRAPEHPKRNRDERRLGVQLDAARRSGARAIFVPGNHDWSNGDANGWDAIRRQTRYVEARGASMLPPNGCPGPATLGLGDGLALVMLDTQWWLHDFAKPSDASAGCAAADEAAVEAAIATALRDAGERHAIVLAHHPLASGGPHGGQFGWREHIFPLRELDRRLWVPLPVLGSIWPILRMLDASDQDLGGPRYRALAARLGRAFADAPPLVFAAGHDHSLQVLRAGPARFQIVSGAGSAKNLTWAYAVDGSLFHSAASGYIRLDAYAGGAVEVAVRRVGADGAADAYRACLAESR